MLNIPQLNDTVRVNFSIDNDRHLKGELLYIHQLLFDFPPIPSKPFLTASVQFLMGALRFCEPLVYGLRWRKKKWLLLLSTMVSDGDQLGNISSLQPAEPAELVMMRVIRGSLILILKCTMYREFHYWMHFFCKFRIIFS